MPHVPFGTAEAVATVAMALLVVVLVLVRRLRADSFRQARMLEDALDQQRGRHADLSERVVHLERSRSSPLTGLLSRRMGAIEAIAESIARDLRAALAAPARLGEAAERAARRAEQLARLAAGGRAREDRVTLSSIWPRVLELVGRGGGAAASVRALLDESLPALVGSGEEWVQILVALIENGIEADPADGIVEVGAAPGEDGRAHLWVQDAGRGIATEVLAEVMEPGYTSRAEAGAEGLGLAMVAALVEGMGGQVRVTSTPGKGTRVDLAVPFAPVAPAAPPRAPLALAGTLLVADDDPQMRQSLARMVRSFGAEAVECDTGTVARSTLLAEPERFAAAVLDVVMPGTPVGDIVAGMRERRRGFPVLLVSGYNTMQMVDAVMALGGVRFLPKPFTREELHTALEDLLGGTPDATSARS